MLTMEDKIIGYDDDSDVAKVFKPQEMKLSSLGDKELKALMLLIREHPEGGNMRIDEVQAVQKKQHEKAGKK
jgi:hypothetical protein